MSRGRSVVAVTLPLLALVLSGAATAQADPGPVPDSVYTCVFDGTATTGPPPPPAVQDGVDAIVPDLLFGPPLDTDTGSYSLTAGAVCVHEDGDTDLDGGAGGVFTTVLTGDGTYTNLLCGTGTATSIAATTTLVAVPAFPFAAPAGFEGAVALEYGITIAGGVGQMSILASNTPAGVAPVETGSGTGVVDFLPTGGAGGDCIFANATVINARGSFTIQLS